MIIILILISLFLDGLLSVKISTSSYFLPLLTLTTLFLIYPKCKKKEITFLLLATITGFLYDLLYTNLLFLHAIVFFILTKLIKYLYQNYHQNTFKQLIYLVVVIIFYELLLALLLFIFQTTDITLNKTLTIISKSLLLNIIYALLLKPLLKIKNN